MTPLIMEFRRLMSDGLDISEHLGLLRGLASHPCVETIVEIGFRTGVSATALASAGKTLHCIDIDPCVKGVRRLRDLGAKFTFEQADSLKIKIPPCDLLHVDSKHTYEQLAYELDAHSDHVRKWIALHDTETFAKRGQDGSRLGLQDAVNHFLRSEAESWKILLHLPNNNGMTVLERC